MAEKPNKFRAIKGTRDILPPETALWNRVEQIAREVFATYNFQEIRLPIFEETEVFARSVGLDTDIISKEMYSIENKLEHLRDALRKIPDLKEPARLFKFLQLLAVFADNLERAYHFEQIPKTLDNHATIATLSKSVQHSVSRWNHGQQTPSPEWDDWFQNILRLVEAVSIGDTGSLTVIMLSENESLRPEGTASVVRAYIEHGMHTLPGNVKLYYIGPMFRRERPQKGRYRQFYQIGAEILGQSDHPAIDAEVIEMLMAFFERAGLTGTTLHINSIGCKECRPKYVDELRNALLKVKDKLGADSQRRIETNPLRVLDSKLESEQALIEKLPRIADHLCNACREHFAQLQVQLNERGIAYELNWRLVRGLDYYMRTTFEITAPGLGAQNAICGGGRYDGLVELLGGPPTKGIGFAIGTDRLVLSLLETGKVEPGLRRDVTVPVTGISLRAEVGNVKVVLPLDVFIAWMGAAAQPEAVKIARKLRDAGFSVEVPPEETKLKKSLGLADKLGARYAVIIGQDEVDSRQFVLKRLADADQKKLNEQELIEHLKSDRRGK